jgi:hypothetical protein
VDINGVTPDYAVVRDWVPRVGEFISEADNQGMARVAVLGQDTADYFFPDDPDPTGEWCGSKASPSA